MMPRVRPGVLEVRASARRPTSRLSSVDLPTLDRPAMATSGAPGTGRGDRGRTSIRKFADITVGGSGRAMRFTIRCPGGGHDQARRADRRNRLGQIDGGQHGAALGVPVIDADRLAREVVEPGTPALAEIAADWPEVIAPDGTLDRQRLGARVFADPAARGAGGHHPPAHPGTHAPAGGRLTGRATGWCSTRPRCWSRPAGPTSSTPWWW